MKQLEEVTLELINEYESILPVMHHFMQGGKVEYQHRNTNNEWMTIANPRWCKESHYRIKSKKVELLYEWWYKDGGGMYFADKLRTEKEAQYQYKTKNTFEYGKTGRYFNPETKVFGVE